MRKLGLGIKLWVAAAFLLAAPVLQAQDRETLRARIDERLQRRLDAGMIEEVRGLIDRGVSLEFLMKLGLEYRFITR